MGRIILTCDFHDKKKKDRCRLMQALALPLPCEKDVLMPLCVGVEYMPEPRFCMRLKKC